MHYSFLSRIRDILLLCALLFLVRTAFERTTSFINDHKKSIVHELDRNFIEQIYAAQRQLHFLEENHMHNDEIVHAVADIKERLASIEEQYKTNSAGLMILGPIGSAAIVSKEEKLNTKLLDVANDITTILQSISHHEYNEQRAETISCALENNKKMLHTITV
jgi:hypothetical protein